MSEIVHTMLHIFWIYQVVVHCVDQEPGSIKVYPLFYAKVMLHSHCINLKVIRRMQQQVQLL